MRTRQFGFGAVCLVTLLSLVFSLPLGAQNKPAKPPKMYNVQGKVQSLDKSKMDITVTTGSQVHKDVVYNADTKFLYGHSKNNKPGSADQVKENYFISCAGTYEKGASQLTAKECVYRETK